MQSFRSRTLTEDDGAAAGRSRVSSEIVARNEYGFGAFTPLGFVSDSVGVYWLGIKDISLTVLDVRRGGVKPLVRVGMGLC